MADHEIELQVKVENIQPLIDFLEKNAKFRKENRQIDEYYSPKHRNFLDSNPVNEWLRLRNSEGNFFITYKNYHYDKGGDGNFCDEFETEVGDIEKLRKIMRALDFRLLGKVDKVRKIWDYEDYEISVDSVKDFGDFVEVEYKGKEDGNPQDIINKIISFLKSLECGKLTRNKYGYAFMVIFPNKDQHEIL